MRVIKGIDPATIQLLLEPHEINDNPMAVLRMMEDCILAGHASVVTVTSISPLSWEEMQKLVEQAA